MRVAAFITLLASVVSAAPAETRSCSKAKNTCPVVFDGRVPANASLTDFDKENGGGWNPYNPGFVKGNNISWSEIIKLPQTTRSRFDATGKTIPLEVTISDESIFMKQFGFRRAGLQFSKDKNEGSPGSEGIKTLHFSLMQDESRPLNLSHEYLVSFTSRPCFLPTLTTIERLAREGRFLWKSVPVPSWYHHWPEPHCRDLEAI